MKSNNCYANKKILTFDQIKEEELLVIPNDEKHIVLAERIMVGAFDVSNIEDICIEPFNDSLPYGIKATAAQSIDMLYLSELKCVSFENPYVESNPVETLLIPFIDSAKNLELIEIFHSVKRKRSGLIKHNNSTVKEMCSYLETSKTVDNKLRFEKKTSEVIPKKDFNRRFYQSSGTEIQSDYYQTTTFSTINNPLINDRCCSHG